jgi:excisionase family DNA binding protein
MGSVKLEVVMTKAPEVNAVEAARKLGVGLDYVYSLLWTGKLAGEKIAGRWRIPMSAIEARIAAQRGRNG